MAIDTCFFTATVVATMFCFLSTVQGCTIRVGTFYPHGSVLSIAQNIEHMLLLTTYNMCIDRQRCRAIV